jgi:hypothetical protein
VPAHVLIEEFHVSATASSRLAARAQTAARRVLTGRRFRAALARAVRGVRARFPALAPVRLTVST